MNVSGIVNSPTFKPYLERMEKAMEPSIEYDSKIGRYPTLLESSWSALYFDNACDEVVRIVLEYIKSNNLSRNYTDDIDLTEKIMLEAIGVEM